MRIYAPPIFCAVYHFSNQYVCLYTLLFSLSLFLLVSKTSPAHVLPCPTFCGICSCQNVQMADADTGCCTRPSSDHQPFDTSSHQHPHHDFIYGLSHQHVLQPAKSTDMVQPRLQTFDFRGLMLETLLNDGIFGNQLTIVYNVLHKPCRGGIVADGITRGRILLVRATSTEKVCYDFQF